MIRGLIRYLAFVLVAATLIYGGYRMLTPATTKTTASEKAEKEERSDSVVLSDAKVAAAGIELAKASPGVLRDRLLLWLQKLEWPLMKAASASCSTGGAR